MPADKDEYLQLIRLFNDVDDAHDRAIQRKSDRDERYWQGKKDGVRTSITVVAPTEADRHRWELANESSPAQLATEREILAGQVQQAYDLFEQELESSPHDEWLSISAADARTFIMTVDHCRACHYTNVGS